MVIKKRAPVRLEYPSKGAKLTHINLREGAGCPARSNNNTGLYPLSKKKEFNAEFGGGGPKMSWFIFTGSEGLRRTSKEKKGEPRNLGRKEKLLRPAKKGNPRTSPIPECRGR